MRVLWIGSTPGLGAEALGVSAALGWGWVGALEGAVRAAGQIELTVAFPWDVPQLDQVEVSGRTYLPFPAYPRGGRLAKTLFDLTCRLEPETEIRHLEGAIERARPDLVHVWGTEDYYGLVAERCDRPLLIEIQGIRTQYVASYFDGLSRGELLRLGSAARLVTGRSLLQRYWRYRRSAVRERRILATARHISGRTRWDRQTCRVLAPRAHYYHCDRVLRPPFYGPTWKPRSSGGPIELATTVRGNAYKGLETVWECARRLGELWPAGVRWTIIGVRADEEVVRIVERKLGAAGPRNIQLAGRLAAEQVAARLLDSDLYVHPSHIDNSPNGLSEAMRLGLPVVSTQVGGIPSLLEDTREGLLVPPGDPWAMAGAVLEIAGDPALATRLGEAARDRARRRHDPASVADTLIGIYRQILDREA